MIPHHVLTTQCTFYCSYVDLLMFNLYILCCFVIFRQHYTTASDRYHCWFNLCHDCTWSHLMDDNKRYVTMYLQVQVKNLTSIRNHRNNVMKQGRLPTPADVQVDI